MPAPKRTVTKTERLLASAYRERPMELEQSSLSIVTIFRFGDGKELNKTLKSIEMQYRHPDELILVLSNCQRIVPDTRNINACVKIFRDLDRGIYDAMNIGLNCASGTHVYFLNGGDVFTDCHSMSRIMQGISNYPTKALIFQTAQVFAELQFLRPKKNECAKANFSPPHQGFIAPVSHVSELRFQQDKFPIAADSHWMKEVLARSGFVFEQEVICEFALGGVSNNPSLQTVKIRFREAGFARAVKEIVKFVLKRLLGARLYYRLLLSEGFWGK